MNKEPTSYSVPTGIQKLFVIGVALPVLVQTIYFTVSSFVSTPGTTNVLSQFSYVLAYSLTPLLLFGLAYALNPKRLGFVARAFESMLISIVGMSIWGLVNLAIPVIMFQLGSTYGFGLFNFISTISLLAITAAILVTVRARGIWR